MRSFSALLGRSRTRTALLVLSSTAMGLAEAGVLAMVARAATSLANGSSTVDGTLGPFHVHASLRHFLLAGAALACLRLVLAVAHLGARRANHRRRPGNDAPRPLRQVRPRELVREVDRSRGAPPGIDDESGDPVGTRLGMGNEPPDEPVCLPRARRRRARHQPARGDDRRRRVGGSLRVAPPAEPSRHPQRARAVGRAARSGRRRERGDASGRRDSGIRRRRGPAEAGSRARRPQQHAALPDTARGQARRELLSGRRVPDARRRARPDLRLRQERPRVPWRRRPSARPRRHVRERGTERVPGGPAVTALRRSRAGGRGALRRRGHGRWIANVRESRAPCLPRRLVRVSRGQGRALADDLRRRARRDHRDHRAVRSREVDAGADPSSSARAQRRLVPGQRGACRRAAPLGLDVARRLRAADSAALLRLRRRQHPLLPRSSTTRRSSVPRDSRGSTTTS